MFIWSWFCPFGSGFRLTPRSATGFCLPSSAEYRVPLPFGSRFRLAYIYMNSAFHLQWNSLLSIHSNCLDSSGLPPYDLAQGSVNLYSNPLVHRCFNMTPSHTITRCFIRLYIPHFLLYRGNPISYTDSRIYPFHRAYDVYKPWVTNSRLQNKFKQST